MVYIKDVLKKYGITQIALAERLGINRVSLNATLNNPNIKLSTLEKIADAIGCDVTEFFTPASTAVSIHTPVWGVTRCHAPFFGDHLFQSTRPCGA